MTSLPSRRLTQTLRKFQDKYIKMWPEIHGDDFTRIRSEISQIKEDAVGNLEGLADEFERRITSRGAVVHRARDAREANLIIGRLCEARKVRKMVKSKSMTTEEIGINGYLEKHGVTAVETDLGEWIVQLLDHRPSHMVMPAIHLDREEIAQLFSRTSGRQISSDIAELVRVARELLRKEFLTADMGMTGANMMAADQGMATIVTNEGNGRLVVTMPSTHVVVAGYEKLIPSVRDIPLILKGLCGSATGRRITSYVTMMGAPLGGGSDRIAGRDQNPEMHVVLLDAGRLEAARGPMGRALKCIRCGSCANVCPAFGQVGGHRFAGVLSGPIGVVLSHVLGAQGGGAESLCLGCGRCGEVCPADVDVPSLILEARRARKERSLERSAVRVVLPRPALIRAGARTLSRLQRLLGSRQGWQLPGDRRLPPLAPVPFSQRARSLPEGGSGPTVALYAGCLVEHVFPEIGESIWHLLSRSGFRPLYPAGQECCGAPALMAGDEASQRRVLERNLGLLRSLQADHILTPCPTCTWILRDLMPEMVSRRLQPEEIAARVVDFSEAEERLGLSFVPAAGDRAEEPVTYHDSCHLRWKLGVWEQPRGMIESLPGAQFREMERADRCCGFGGSYCFKHPDVSSALREEKIDAVLAAKADLAVSCPGCLLHIRQGLQERGSSLRVEHLAQLAFRLQADPR